MSRFLICISSFALLVFSSNTVFAQEEEKQVCNNFIHGSLFGENGLYGGGIARILRRRKNLAFGVAASYGVDEYHYSMSLRAGSDTRDYYYKIIPVKAIMNVYLDKRTHFQAGLGYRWVGVNGGGSDAPRSYGAPPGSSSRWITNFSFGHFYGSVGVLSIPNRRGRVYLGSQIAFNLDPGLSGKRGSVEGFTPRGAMKGSISLWPGFLIGIAF